MFDFETESLKIGYIALCHMTEKDNEVLRRGANSGIYPIFISSLQDAGIEVVLFPDLANDGVTFRGYVGDDIYNDLSDNIKIILNFVWKQGYNRVQFDVDAPVDDEFMTFDW